MLQVPIHLAEMSPPGFRATFPGVTYQMGNVGSFVPGKNAGPPC